MPPAEPQSVKEKATAFVVFGATGDLARKKIFPSFKEYFLWKFKKIMNIAISSNGITNLSGTKKSEKGFEKRYKKSRGKNDRDDISSILPAAFFSDVKRSKPKIPPKNPPNIESPP